MLLKDEAGRIGCWLGWTESKKSLVRVILCSIIVQLMD
jgi:hypothetical protein